MRFWPQQQRPSRARIGRALTASVASGTFGGGSLRRLSQVWQDSALGFYDTLGECHDPAQFIARAMQRIRFYPAVLDEKGDPQEIEGGPLVELWDRVQDPGGGRSELQGTYGRLIWLIGEGYLTVTQPEGEPEAWEFLSPLELRKNEDADPITYRRIRAPGITPQELREAPDDVFDLDVDEARVWRFWQRHPTYSAWADSPVRSVLQLYKLLEWLTKAAEAESSSRAAQRGGLYVPDELEFGSGDVNEPDEDPLTDPFIQELTEGLTRAIHNPGTAEAAAPFVIRGPGVLEYNGSNYPVVDLLKWFPLGPTQSEYGEAEMWDKTIRRIAIGLDFPPEALTGLGELNHWSGWLVDEQAFRQHIAPKAEAFARDMTAAYLRPAAFEAGVADAERVVVWYDPAAAVNHPDEAKTAKEAWKDGAVSAGYYRTKIGATEDDAPGEDDQIWLLSILGKTPVTSLEEDEAATAPQDGGTGNDVDEDAPEPETAEGNGAVAAATLRAAHVLGALDLTVHRARELAGNRLITKSQGCESCRERIAGIPAATVASALGAEEVRAIINGRGPESDLVSGAADGVAATIARWGVPADVALELGKLAEQHALRTLYEAEPPPLPAGMHAAVAKAMQ